MAYSAPLSERIRIQIEILGENVSDCCSSISQSYKRPLLIICGIGALLTVRTARRMVRDYKDDDYGDYGSSYGSSYGAASSAYGASSYGKGATAATGYGAYGTGASTYGASSLGTGGYGATGSMYGGAPLGGGSTALGGAALGAGGYRAPVGGAGGALGGIGGGAAGGRSTANLADSHGHQVVTLDPSVHLYDYGGAASFSGQIETVQAFDSPTFVSQVLGQPGGQNKVLVIEGGGPGQSTGAVFDAAMAAAAARNGWKGVIVHGLVRDVDQLSRVQLGVKALGTTPMKGKGAMGQKGTALQIGNSQIQPGWWVYADKDGVLMSQQDISGGMPFGGGSGMGGMMPGGLGGASSSTMGGYGSASTMGTGLGGGIRGGYGVGVGGGLGGTAAGGTLAGGYSGSAARSTIGGGALAGGYGSTTGGYGSTTGGMTGLGGARTSSMSTGGTTGYGGASSSTYGDYGSTYRAKRKKNKMIKLALASAIAAVVWLLCLS